MGDPSNSRSWYARSRARVANGLLLTAPGTPMLFMGQEFAASTRFMFFADHHEELAALVHKGRREFLSQFRAYADEAAQQLVPAQRTRGRHAAITKNLYTWSSYKHWADKVKGSWEEEPAPAKK